MSSQTHTKRIRKSETKKSLTKNRKVSKKKTLYKEDYKGGDNTENYEDFYEQSGGDFNEIKNYKMDGQKVYDALITFKSNVNLNTISNNYPLFYHPSKPINTAYDAPTDVGLDQNINKKYILLSSTKEMINNQNGFGIQTIPDDKTKTIPDRKTKTQYINNSLSASLMTELIKPNVLESIDNIYLSNPKKTDYLGADSDSFNVIVLPFAIHKKKSKTFLYLLSHYIGNKTALLSHGDAQDNIFFENKPETTIAQDNNNNSTGSTNKKSDQWRPFFCNYNHGTYMLNGFIDSDHNTLTTNSTSSNTNSNNTNAKRNNNKNIKVNQNLFYHILNLTCNSINTETNTNSNDDFLSKIMDVPAPKDNKDNSAEKYTGVNNGKAISLEIFTIPNCGNYNNLKAKGKAKLFPEKEKVIVISFLVNDSGIHNFPIVDANKNVSDVYSFTNSSYEDGAVAWVPIASKYDNEDIYENNDHLFNGINLENYNTTPYAWFLGLVNENHTNLPKILQNNDGFKINFNKKQMVFPSLPPVPLPMYRTDSHDNFSFFNNDNNARLE
jgi:hypothetical protein